jgi:hypothetical protein
MHTAMAGAWGAIAPHVFYWLFCKLFSFFLIFRIFPLATGRDIGYNIPRLCAEIFAQPIFST